MKELLVCVVAVFIHATAAAGAMYRVVEVRGSHTVVIERDGASQLVGLRDVSIPPQDETAAAAYLSRTVTGAWVYVENGEIYRSPDGLHVNGAMRRRAWLGMTPLGQLDLGPRTERQTSPPTVKAPPDKPVKKRAAAVPRRRRPARPHRAR